MNKGILVLAALAALSAQAVSAEPKLTTSGLIQVEAMSGGNESDITVATVELDVAAEISERVTGKVVFLYEEDDTPLEVDVATIRLALTEEWDVTGGQMYVPFGVFETKMISDPLTLELGETRASALQATYQIGSFLASAYTFNGVSEDNEEKNIDNHGVTVGYDMEGEDLVIALRAGYIANMGDSDSLAIEILEDRVPGVNGSVSLVAGSFSFIGEYVAARDDFNAGEGSFTNTAKPVAWNAEIAYARDNTTVAVGIQKTHEAEDLALPKQRVLATLSTEVMENTAVALEWAQDESYADEITDIVTAQLTVTF